MQPESIYERVDSLVGDPIGQLVEVKYNIHFGDFGLSQSRSLLSRSRSPRSIARSLSSTCRQVYIYLLFPFCQTSYKIKLDFFLIRLEDKVKKISFQLADFSFGLGRLAFRRSSGIVVTPPFFDFCRPFQAEASVAAVIGQQLGATSSE